MKMPTLSNVGRTVYLSGGVLIVSIALVLNFTEDCFFGILTPISAIIYSVGVLFLGIALIKCSIIFKYEIQLGDIFLSLIIGCVSIFFLAVSFSLDYWVGIFW